MAKTKKEEKSTVTQNNFAFGRTNYMWMIIGLVVVVVGFITMSGGEGDIYDFRRTVLAPIIVLLGFGIEIYAIMKKQ